MKHLASQWIRLGLALLASACAASGAGCGSSAPASPKLAADSGPGPTDDAASTDAEAPDPIGFRASGTLVEARALATATRLLDGRVLIAGGERSDYRMLASAEIYDPSTDSVTPAAPMPEPRAHHTATVLANGEVLVIGGGQGSRISIPSGDGVLASAILYDPAKNTWRATGNLRGARAGHRAVPLADGRVLVVGGGDRVGYPCDATHGPDCTIAISIGTAEIYDPATETFSPTGDLDQPRVAFTLDVLGSGRVVAAGGAADNAGLTSVEIFDPSGGGGWSKAPPLDGQRLYHASGVLGASLVVVGGKIANVGPISTTDVLDDGGRAWRKGASVDVPRTGAKLVPLTSGRGLLVGGNNQFNNEALSDARVYDAASDRWTPIEPLERARYGHAAVLLDDGSVLVAGGRNNRGAVRHLERTR